MSKFQQKTTRHAKQQKTRETGQGSELDSDVAEILELSDCETTTIKMLRILANEQEQMSDYASVSWKLQERIKRKC